MKKKSALSIAGSDSSGGAGIQADLKSFSYLGVHGVTVITCITAQNTQQVRTIYKVPSEIIEDQIECLFDDFSIATVKTGMLYNDTITKIVIKKLKTYHIRPVVDPIMIATSGDELSHPTFINILKKELLPQAMIVTANIPEAQALIDMEITEKDDMESVCKKIYKLGPNYVLLKGGHLPGEMVTDYFYDGKKIYKFILPRISQRIAHGSGCTLSALITGFLTLGEKPITAVKKAKYIVWGMIQNGYHPGKGSDVLNYSSTIQIPPIVQSNEQILIWLHLKNAIQKIITILPNHFIPEVGINFAYALPNAKTLNDICAINGRIIKHKEQPHLCGTLEFGVSKHIASIILAAMSYDKTIRAAVNIKYSIKTVDLCKKLGFSFGSFDRKNEPPNVTSTMDWGTNYVITKLNQIPDLIYDSGSVGKEPMIRILGKNPDEVIFKISKLINDSKS
jgi:hydroxymethylpyrimidine kinase/phosphomethylpyrimidine kinase